YGSRGAPAHLDLARAAGRRAGVSDAVGLTPMDLALIALLILLASGIALLIQARRRRAGLGLPPGEVIYQDTLARLDETLFSRRHRLAGRPDYLLRDGEWLIPVEVKTGRTPNYPYPGQVMQCVAYCALVEEHFGVRPPYGIILFEQSGKQFTIKIGRAHV